MLFFEDAAEVDAADDFDLPAKRIGFLGFNQMLEGFMIQVDQGDSVVPLAQRSQIKIVSIAGPQDT